MCGRYTIFTEEEIIEIRSIIEEINRKMGTARPGDHPGIVRDVSSSQLSLEEAWENPAAVIPGFPDITATGEVYPTARAPILALENGIAVPCTAKWGFLSWNGKTVINARSETALEKSMFRKPLLQKRCVIPSTGFFEWRRAGNTPDGNVVPPAMRVRKTSEKYLCRLRGENMLYMAGMTDTFKDADGNAFEAFVILTAPATRGIDEIHDRMPVILARDECDKWLHGGSFVNEVLSRNGPELCLELAG